MLSHKHIYFYYSKGYLKKNLLKKVLVKQNNKKDFITYTLDILPVRQDIFLRLST